MDKKSLVDFLKDNLRIEITQRPYGENYISVKLQVRNPPDTRSSVWDDISEDSFTLD